MVRFFYAFIFSLLFANLLMGQAVPATHESNGDGVLGLAEIKKSNLLAATLLTGLVGGHRILLNKKAITPIVYSATLGGGLGFLPLMDFFIILFTKKENLKELNHEHFFLFNKNE